jgi:Rrf2 family transcriptional regulator, repressor of oqxAB
MTSGGRDDGDGMIDLRFPTALQMVLGIQIAEEDGVRCTSQKLADSLGVNASFVRKLLVPLSRDGIVTSSLGKNGGARLARSSATITLRDIYRSVTDDKKIWVARTDLPCQCVASANIVEFFECIASEADALVLDMLARRTVADSIAEIRNLERTRSGRLR